MEKVVKNILVDEYHTLNELLMLLEEQHKLYLSKDIFGLEEIVEKIEKSNIAIAQLEIKKKQVLGDSSIKTLIAESNDEELKTSFKSMEKLVQKIKHQNETNQLLFKQGLIFTNRMLSIFRPNGNAKTYNPYGKISK